MAMGSVHAGPPAELILQLKDRYQLTDFIETGTYYGHTAMWAASHFESVISIEYSQALYERALVSHGRTPNASFIFGDSRTVLKDILPKLRHPAIFWLDSHWSGGETYGENDECPLIDEIRAITKSPCVHFVFVDDARLFTSPPPRPHRIEVWPPIAKVIEAFESSSKEYYIVIIEDIIIAVPGYAKAAVASYCQERNTKAWEEYGRRVDASAFTQGWRLIGQAFRLFGRGAHVQLRRLASRLSDGAISR
jgi:hypothetical protein